MTGRRLIKQLVSWDFEDCRGWGNPKPSARKKWSKKLRKFLKKEDFNSLNID